MPVPMLSDFAIRMAGGLAAMLVMAPWRLIPPKFFRTHCLVMLGLLGLAGLFEGAAVPVAILAVTIASAAFAFAGSVAWGMGLDRLGATSAWLTAGLSTAILTWASAHEPAGSTMVGLVASLATRLASSALMGSTLTAMLLGHHYLTAPAMSIDPLKRFVAAMIASLAARTLISGLGMALWLGSGAGGPAVSGDFPLFLAMRWGMGLVVPAVAAYMTAKTVAIRSTQSATGILYIAMTLILFGELSAMILTRATAYTF